MFSIYIIYFLFKMQVVLGEGTVRLFPKMGRDFIEYVFLISIKLLPIFGHKISLCAGTNNYSILANSVLSR